MDTQHVELADDCAARLGFRVGDRVTIGESGLEFWTRNREDIGKTVTIASFVYQRDDDNKVVPCIVPQGHNSLVYCQPLCALTHANTPPTQLTVNPSQPGTSLKGELPPGPLAVSGAAAVLEPILPVRKYPWDRTPADQALYDRSRAAALTSLAETLPDAGELRRLRDIETCRAGLAEAQAAVRWWSDKVAHWTAELKQRGAE